MEYEVQVTLFSFKNTAHGGGTLENVGPTSVLGVSSPPFSSSLSSSSQKQSLLHWSLFKSMGEFRRLNNRLRYLFPHMSMPDFVPENNTGLSTQKKRKILEKYMKRVVSMGQLQCSDLSMFLQAPEWEKEWGKTAFIIALQASVNMVEPGRQMSFSLIKDLLEKEIGHPLSDEREDTLRAHLTTLCIEDDSYLSSSESRDSSEGLDMHILSRDYMAGLNRSSTSSDDLEKKNSGYAYAETEFDSDDGVGMSATEQHAEICSGRDTNLAEDNRCGVLLDSSQLTRTEDNAGALQTYSFSFELEDIEYDLLTLLLLCS